ncbi:MAG: AAA family ATPase, partial [Phaeodactylibacter sp.]|nr:AAA family ATPase [Phaeodactylibacter sp.]
MEEPRTYDIADIHEDVLQFLLNFREEEERQDFYFLLRPNDSLGNQEALRKGWWFTGNEKYVNIFFAISRGQNRWQNNFQLSILKNASWRIKWEIEKSASDRAEVYRFVEESMAGFSSLGKYEFKEKYFSYFFEPKKEHYRDSLPEAINIIEKFLQQDRFSTQEWLRKITPGEFYERLDYIQNLRELKSKTTLKGISIDNYHGIKETKPPDLPETAPWIFLTGENGFGKTSVLQALAIGLYGNTEDPIIPKNGKAVIEAVYQGENQTRTFTHINNIRYPGFFRPVKTLACYGPSRLQL